MPEMPFFIDVLNHDHTNDRNNGLMAHSRHFVIMHIIIVAKPTVKKQGSTKSKNGIEYHLSSSSLHFTWPRTFVHKYFRVET